MNVSLSDEEAAFYKCWVAYVAARSASFESGAPGAWATNMRERQAASSLQCAYEVLEELLHGDAPTGVESSDPDLSVADGVPATAGMSELMRRRRAEVIDAAQALSVDSKSRELVRILADVLRANESRKVLLFTFFKGTLRFLARTLAADGVRCYSISGDNDPDDRSDIVAAFKADPNARVLLSTEVGAEGLDFQFCDTVINYDLPWNPMRVEQRIGRIDRFGQKSPFVDVISFFVDGTIDTAILQRLYDRIRVFEESIGELEPILGPIVKEIATDALSLELSDDEKMLRADEAISRIENLRIRNEEFESGRAELLGQGELVRHEIESIRTSGRYLTSNELAALVIEWLGATSFARDALETTDRTEIYNLRLTPMMNGRLGEWTAHQRRNDPLVASLLRKLHTDHHAWITFDNDVAQQNGNLPFVDFSHPIVQLALADAEKSDIGSPLTRVGTLRMMNKGDWPPLFILFIYRLRVSGAEPKTVLVPVVMDVSEGSVVEIGEDVLGSLASSSGNRIPDSVDATRIEELQEAAFRSADSKRLELLRYSRDMQKARLASRRATIERSYRVRIDRANDVGRRVSDQRIKRLYEGQARSLAGTLKAKLNEIEGAGEPEAALDLLSIAVIQA